LAGESTERGKDGTVADRLSLGNTLRILEDVIGLTRKRQTLIASNISNLETPGYRAKDLDFKTALARAVEGAHGLDLATTDPGHIQCASGPAFRADPFDEKGEWNGYNWVNIEREMLKLMENNLRYKTATEILLRKLALLKEVIREGGR